MGLLSADLSEKLRITLRDEDVVLRLMKLEHLVRVIKALVLSARALVEVVTGCPAPPTQPPGQPLPQSVVMAFARPYLFGDDAGIA